MNSRDWVRNDGMMMQLTTVCVLTFLASACVAQQIETITYPRKDINPQEVFTQETLEQSIDYLFSWQQAAGTFGHLTLHSCWAVDGVIGRNGCSRNERRITISSSQLCMGPMP